MKSFSKRNVKCTKSFQTFLNVMNKIYDNTTHKNNIKSFEMRSLQDDFEIEINVKVYLMLYIFTFALTSYLYTIKPLNLFD